MYCVIRFPKLYPLVSVIDPEGTVKLYGPIVELLSIVKLLKNFAINRYSVPALGTDKFKGIRVAVVALGAVTVIVSVSDITLPALSITATTIRPPVA
jgi:hypothetical protein